MSELKKCEDEHSTSTEPIASRFRLSLLEQSYSTKTLKASYGASESEYIRQSTWKKLYTENRDERKLITERRIISILWSPISDKKIPTPINTKAVKQMIEERTRQKLEQKIEHKRQPRRKDGRRKTNKNISN